MHVTLTLAPPLSVPSCTVRGCPAVAAAIGTRDLRPARDGERRDADSDCTRGRHLCRDSSS
jgi:hypothetical protein